jgi:hypothetical protein
MRSHEFREEAVNPRDERCARITGLTVQELFEERRGMKLTASRLPCMCAGVQTRAPPQSEFQE